MKKSTLKLKSLHPGIHRLFELLRKNTLSGAQFALLYDVTDLSAAPNPFLQEMKPYIDQLVITGWLNEDGKTLTEKGSALFAEVEKLFKVNKNVAPDVPAEIAEQFNQIFPAIKGGSNKYLRCNLREVVSSLQWFRKNYPQYDFDTILQATSNYVEEQQVENFKYTRRSKYFVKKQQQDKTYESDLAEYCERLKEGIQETNENSFQEKVV